MKIIKKQQPNQEIIYKTGNNTWIDKKILNDNLIQETRYIKLNNDYFKPYITNIKKQTECILKDGEEVFYKNGQRQSVFWMKNTKISPEDFKYQKETYGFLKPDYSSLDFSFTMSMTLKHIISGKIIKIFTGFNFYDNYKNIRFFNENVVVIKNNIWQEKQKYRTNNKKTFSLKNGRKFFLETVEKIIEPEQIENYQILKESGLNIKGQNEYDYVVKFSREDEKFYAKTKVSFDNITNNINNPSKNLIKIENEQEEILDVLLPYYKPNISIEEYDKLLTEKVVNWLTLDEIKNQKQLEEQKENLKSLNY